MNRPRTGETGGASTRRLPSGMRATILSASLFMAACSGAVGAPSTAGSANGALVYLAGLDLSGAKGLGGLSGLHVSDDGESLIAVSDDGRLITGALAHTSLGAMKSWTIEREAPLPGLEGADKKDADAEALLRQPDGSWLVTFERRHRIERYPGGEDGPAGAPRSLEVPASLKSLPANKGIEALALRPDGTLVAFAEATETADGQHRLYLRQGDEWTEKRYRTDSFFSPSDAAALPNGDILVLDRGYSLAAGVRSRLIHVKSEDLLSSDIVEGAVLGDIEPPIGTDNFEGLAIRQAPDGRVYVYLISDDNFSPLQRTLLVQYELRLPQSAEDRPSP